MRNLCSQHAKDHCFKVSKSSVQRFQRRRFLKNFTGDDDRRKVQTWPNYPETRRTFGPTISTILSVRPIFRWIDILYENGIFTCFLRIRSSIIHYFKTSYILRMLIKFLSKKTKVAFWDLNVSLINSLLGSLSCTQSINSLKSMYKLQFSKTCLSFLLIKHKLEYFVYRRQCRSSGPEKFSCP